MTIIAALHQDGETWIGADSQRSFGSIKFNLRTSEKLIQGPGVVLGLSGDELGNNLIRRDLPKVFAAPDPWGIGQAIRSVLEAGGFRPGTQDHDDRSLCWGIDVIVAKPEGVWHLGANFALTAVPKGTLWANGSGHQVALGAGSATRGLVGPDERVRRAVKAAIEWEKGCSGPQHLMRVLTRSQRARG